MEFDRQNRCRTPFLARLKLQAASLYAYRLYNYRCTRSYSFHFSTFFISLFFLLALRCIGRRCLKIINLRFDMEDAECEWQREQLGRGEGCVLLKTWIYRRRHKYKRSHRSRRNDQRHQKVTKNSEKCARRRNTLNAHKYPSACSCNCSGSGLVNQ